MEAIRRRDDFTDKTFALWLGALASADMLTFICAFECIEVHLRATGSATCSLSSATQTIYLSLQCLVFPPETFVLSHRRLELSVRSLGHLVLAMHRSCTSAPMPTFTWPLHSKSCKQLRQNLSLLLVLPIERLQMAIY